MIEYKTVVPDRIQDLMEQVDKRRKSTFPLVFVVDLFLEIHGQCTMDTRDVAYGIIRVTFDPKPLTDTEYDGILNWLLATL